MRTGFRIQATGSEAQPLDRTPMAQMLLNDLIEILGANKSIPDLFRVNHDSGAVLALLQATRLVHPKNAG